MFRNRLEKVWRHRSKQARKQGVSCFRIYDHDLPEFPFCIELYDDKLYVAEYKRNHGMSEEEHDHWMEASLEVMKEVVKVENANIFLKLRQRKPGRLGQYQKYDQEEKGFVVGENGLKFFINLKDYLDTGLFLDHRLTRQRVRAEAEGKKVLNLFAYTGSFSVYAAAGGAAEIVTVDLSNTYLNWAKKNFELNDLDDSAYTFIQADVLQWLENAPADHFDIVIMDPPTFSNSKRMDDFLDIQRDHVKLINQCMKALTKGGVLYFSTNSRKFTMDEKEINAESIKDITKATTPFDFENRLYRYCFRICKRKPA